MIGYCQVCLLLIVATWSGLSIADDGLPKRAPDKVVLKTKTGNGEYAATGRIIDYTGTFLKLETAGGRTTNTIPSSRVIRVETPQVPLHIAGLNLLKKRDYQQASSAFQKALQSETREWVVREIRSQILLCALALGNYVEAGRQFEAIVVSDETTFHDYLIPLNWGMQNPPAAVVLEARRWLTHPSPAVRLLGASWLVFDSQSGNEARKELLRLVRNPKPEIYSLAETQGWRVKRVEEEVGNAVLDLWRKRLTKLPEKFWGGPYYVLAEAQLEQRQNEKAALSFLWVPMLYDHDHFLAAEACWKGSQALEQIGHHDEARRLAAEIVSRFPESPVVVQARQFLSPDDPELSPRVEDGPAGNMP